MKLAEGKSSVKTRKENNEYVTESTYHVVGYPEIYRGTGRGKDEKAARVTWPILRQQASTIGIPLAGEMTGQGPLQGKPG